MVDYTDPSASPDWDPRTRAVAIERLLTMAGLVTTEQLDETVDTFANAGRWGNGARVVARAWVDPAFRGRLLEDGTAAVEELDLTMRGGITSRVALTVVADTPDRRNLLVCTLCSCYPMALLGPPPRWYKDPAYRSRAVLEPRALLAEMGHPVPEDVAVRVWDSTAEMRYMVLPMRPQGTDGWEEEALAQLVTRDSLVGVGPLHDPSGDS
jgi:nitrile hydratase subunit alpha